MEEEEEEEEGRALTLPCAPARGVKERRRMASGSHRGPLHISLSLPQCRVSKLGMACHVWVSQKLCSRPPFKGA